jgi:glycine/D-amino acid oxidase-like deaminating enzyme
MFGSRRLFIQSLASILASHAIGSLPVSNSLPASKKKSDIHVVIAGAGIIGASIAWHLSKAGAKVSVIDAHAPASGASGSSFAWINATYPKQKRSYHALSQKSVIAWKGVADELNIPIKWGGSIEWFDDQQAMERLPGQIAEQQRWGASAKMITPAEVDELEPNLYFNGATGMAYSALDGAVDPIAATHAFLSAAKRLGAKIMYPCRLDTVRGQSDRSIAIETNTGIIKADKLVLATGAAPGLCKNIAGIRLPQRTTPGVIAIPKPMPSFMSRIVAAPGVHLHQRLDGCVVIGEQAGPPDNNAHKMRLAGRPTNFPDPKVAAEHAARMQSMAAKYFPVLESAEFETVTIGWRPLPADGHPVVGAVKARPHIYTAIMHSGVTLAPIIGQFAAQELLGEKLVSDLAPFRLERFA